MNPSTQKKLTERLSALGPTPAPPADLLDKLAADVPSRLTLAPEIADPPNVVRPRFGRPAQRWMALAASLVAVLGGTFVGLRLLEEKPENAAPTVAVDRFEERVAAIPPPPPPAAAQRIPEPQAVAREPEAKEELALLGYVGRADQVREMGVEGGVEGGVPGGVAGGTVGGVPAAEPGPYSYAVPSAPPPAKPTRRDWAVDEVVITDPAALGSSPGIVEDTITVTAKAPVLTERRLEAASSPALAPPSTGGSAEPNDQPYGDVFFRDYGTNPFLDPEEDRFSTFALDVDTGSYGVVRRFLADGHRPPPEAIRVEEMLNAFDYRDPAPSTGDFALTAEAAPTPFGGGERYRVLRFGLKAREITAAERKRANLTFVIDISGSMDQENRLGLVKQALGLLLERLREDDRVALVVYGDEARVVEPGTSDFGRLRTAIDSLQIDGATNAEAGLLLGYDVARRNLRPGAIHRIILCSDGVANVGDTGPDSILERIGSEARRGIELTTLGFGMGNYNDVLMEQLANRGNGRYAYIDDLLEARRLFVDELSGTLETIAADAKAQVEFDPRVVDRYRLIGYENRDVADHRFRDDTVDAGEIGAGHTVTALYEVKLKPEAAPAARLATLRLRYRSVAGERVIEQERPLFVREIHPSFEAAPRSLQLAAVVAEFGELLKGSYWARGGDLGALVPRAERLAFEEFGGDVRVAELAELIGKAVKAGR
ncbi:MAG: von Willebrand factor type A domain-containing protein [Thermoanaerobaculia bacterium]|nr:von Willebrand factor type A domain-containing protein [Thermoanaerobaculia bacterium]